MRTTSTHIVLISALLLTSCKEQTNKDTTSTTVSMENFELSSEKAHPNARKLLLEEFYWSPIEESGPFGNDDGYDAAYGFVSWRPQNVQTSPTVFLHELIEDWGYAKFDYSVLNEEEIERFISATELGERILIGQDNAIIAIGFGQFVLEGKIDKDIQTLTKTALQREMSPVLINMFAPEHRLKRQEQLKKMFSVVEKMTN